MPHFIDLWRSIITNVRSPLLIDENSQFDCQCGFIRMICFSLYTHHWYTASALSNAVCDPCLEDGVHHGLHTSRIIYRMMRELPWITIFASRTPSLPMQIKFYLYFILVISSHSWLEEKNINEIKIDLVVFNWLMPRTETSTRRRPHHVCRKNNIRAQESLCSQKMAPDQQQSIWSC